MPVAHASRVCHWPTSFMGSNPTATALSGLAHQGMTSAVNVALNKHSNSNSKCKTQSSSAWFQKGSLDTAISVLLNDNNIDDRKTTYTVFLDLQKAFKIVSHPILLC